LQQLVGGVVVDRGDQRLGALRDLIAGGPLDLRAPPDGPVGLRLIDDQ
jgi:hypothetical protein